MSYDDTGASDRRMELPVARMTPSIHPDSIWSLPQPLTPSSPHNSSPWAQKVGNAYTLI